MLRIQEACENDLRLIYEMQVEAFQQLLDKYHDHDTSPAAEPFERTLQRFNYDNVVYHLIMLDDSPIGAARVRWQDTTYALVQLLIKPEYQNKGYAQQAMREIERLYPNAKKWVLDTIAQEEKLCYLYEKMGYHKTGQTERVNERMDMVFYEKENALEKAFYKSELKHYGIASEGARLIREQNGVIVARVCYGGKTAVLKCFEKPEFRREIVNYGILQSCGVPTIAVLANSERSILLEDIGASPVYRLGEERDLNDPAVVKAIARWYKTLHTRGVAYVQKHGESMYEEWDEFTLENILAVRERFALSDCEGLKLIIESFDELRRRMDVAPRTLAYNDFYYTNMVVKKDLSEALMFDYNLLGKGCPASDIHNVTYWFSDKNKELFFLEYGEIDEELMRLDSIAAPIVTLISAMKRDIFPEWAKEAKNELNGVADLMR